MMNDIRLRISDIMETFFLASMITIRFLPCKIAVYFIYIINFNRPEDLAVGDPRTP